jgi:hypothetical protein
MHAEKALGEALDYARAADAPNTNLRRVSR